MKRFIVNDKEVGYLHIDEDNADVLKVSYEEQFNIITAHMSVIMERLRDERLYGVHVFKRLMQKIIIIQLKSEDQVIRALHALSIPHACYEVMYDELCIVIDTPLLEKALELEEGFTEKCVAEGVSW